MLSFSQFINESNDHSFEAIEKGDVIRWMGSKYPVKKADGFVITIDGKSREIQISKGMWSERGGIVIEKKEESSKNEK